MIKLRAKSKYFFEGDIIRHLLWGQHEINIEFLNLGQPLLKSSNDLQISVTRRFRPKLATNGPG